MRGLVAGFAAALSCAVLAAGVAPPLERPALVAKRAAEAFLLDVTLASSRIVAVGERGIVVLSDDEGRTWRQAKVPVSVTLTRVAFVDGQRGWAVGHYGVVLHSSDGGETWRRQLDGEEAARIALQATEERVAKSPNAPHLQKQLSEVRRGVAEGADKPFLTLHFSDERNGFVVGAHNLAFRTRDGGRTWEYWSDRIDNPEGLHLYAIGAAGKVLYLAGEQGLFLRSRDGGESFARVATPYKTSYFAAASTTAGEVVLAGLRGHAILSTDGGDTWTPIATTDRASFVAAAAGGPRVLLGSHTGQVYAIEGVTLRAVPAPPVRGLTGIAVNGRALFASGARGVARIAMP